MIKNILIVEDDPITQLSFQIAIENAFLGISINTANNGAQAKYYLEKRITNTEHNPLPVAILTDVNMPCMSGIDLLAWIKQHPALQNIPVVVMSSSDEPEQIQLAMNTGAISYFPKLSSIDKLICIVKSL
ncbi:MAG: response regulator [Heteroscytonema crispum UTEX LB 1556]